jgi:hypothetical protein
MSAAVIPGQEIQGQQIVRESDIIEEEETSHNICGI